MKNLRILLSLCLWAFPVARLGAIEPWATYRGNSKRTGNTDGIAGPNAPKITWVLKSKDNFIASPVPAGDKLFVSGLGGFNVGIFFCLNTDSKLSPDKRILWSKSTPYLKLPTVSTPAIFDGKIIFGDGMHQTNGGALHCLDLADGLPFWRHLVRGSLVHLEGTPAVTHGKAYIGAGAAGVICIDINAITLEGKAFDPPGVRKVLDRRWQDLAAKYEIDKKTDPDFAIPPSEDQLPRRTQTSLATRQRQVARRCACNIC